MARNKLDFKQLMLEKGERIGLGAAAGIMVLLLAMGTYAAAMRDPPSETVAEITGKAAEIQTKLASGPPLSPPNVDPDSLVPVDKKRLNPGEFSFVVEPTIDEGRENKKRVNPTVLEPQEYQIDLVRAQARYLMVVQSGENVRIGILVPKEKTGEKSQPDTNQVNKRWSVFKTPPNIPVYTMNGYMQLQAMTRDEKGLSPDKYNLEFVNIRDKAPTGTKFAETVHPLRLVVITAGFPYRAQLELYRKALKLKSIAELAGSKDLMPNFEPCKVQRRMVLPNGKVTDWVEVNLEDYYRPVLQRSVATQPEDATAKAVIFPKTPLVMPLPKLARGEYPVIKLPKLDDAAKAILAKTEGGKAPILGPLEMRVRGDALNIYEQQTLGDDRRDQPIGDRNFKAGDEAVIPDMCMMRIVDADPTLKPGMTYQYQVKVRLANPNKGQKDKVAYEALANMESIESDWGPADPTKLEVKVSKEMFYYPTKLDDKTLNQKERSDPTLITNKRDVAFLQAQSWIESVRLDPENNASKVPLGDWAIADIPVKRGEFIARTENVEMAIWTPTRESFDLAVPVRKGRPPLGGGRPLPGIPVSFLTEDLLVDWEGGRVEASFKFAPDKPAKNVIENADLEILVMGPDGTLRVMNSAVESRPNSERERRANEVKKLIEDVRSKSKTKPKTDDLAPK